MVKKMSLFLGLFMFLGLFSCMDMEVWTGFQNFKEQYASATPPPAPPGVTPTPDLGGDNFNDGDSSGWTPYGGTWGVTNGEYVMSSGLDGVKSIYEGADWDNYTVQASVFLTDTVHPADGAGIIFRVTNPGVGENTLQGFYVGLNLDGDSFIIDKLDNSQTTVANPSVPLEPDTWYDLKVIADGTHLIVFLDNVQYFDLNDGSFTTGKVGFRCFGDNKKWDNFSLTAIAP